MQQHHPLRCTRLGGVRSGERRSGGAQQGVLVAVVALALCAWLVVIQHEAPELDASTARQSLAELDQLLLAASDREHR